MNSTRRPIWPLATLLALHLASLFGGFLAPNSAFSQNRHLAWAPPTKLRFFDAEGRFHLRPFIYPLTPDPTAIDGFREDHQNPKPMKFFVPGDEYKLLGLMRTNVHFLAVDRPGRILFLGADGVGRDVFARMLVGGRTSLFAGLLAATVSLALGSAVGLISGFAGGKTDAALMRLLELFLALPWLYFLLAVRAFLPLALPPLGGFFLLIAIIGLIGWSVPARLVRGVVLSAKERLFVTASRSFGTPRSVLLLRHVLPQAFPHIATQASVLAPSYVLAEVTLSFLGLGLSEPHPSWGGLLASLQTYHVLVSYHWMLAPAAPLLLTFICYQGLTPRATNT